MTREDARNLESSIEQNLSDYLAKDISKITISLSMSNRLKVTINDIGAFLFDRNNFELVTFNTKNNFIEVNDFEDTVNTIIKCFKDINDNVTQLIWSYEHISDLIGI